MNFLKLRLSVFLKSSLISASVDLHVSYILERRWKLVCQILRLLSERPARKATGYFFEKRATQKTREGKRTTIITTSNSNIKRRKEEYSSFPVTPLVSQVSLQNIYTKAKNRKLWSKIANQVVGSAYS